ncbi:MAG: hypothetical protein DI536_22190 [Archangium gephyra]|uniref:Galactose oxidase n=1 Tax=Archangium gephyra TaxID=48 RepID=A0A2W5V0V1_9BACT|nr:MAG: hypothetical protein DI536_22190 [Archangium gephyra]
MHVRIALLTSFALFSCQPAVKDTPDSGTPVADASVELPDAGAKCPAYSHFEDGGCTSAIEWVQQPSIQGARDHHGTYVFASDAGATLVVINGVDMAQGIAIWDTWSSRVVEHGFLSPWQRGPRPLFWAGGSGVDSYGNRIYSVSGQTIGMNGGENTPRVQSLIINDDGTLKAWVEEKPLSGEGRFHITATRVGRWLYALGGRTVTGRAMPEVWSAHIEDDGSLSDWSTARAFPAPRTHHASFAVGNRLYALGGFDAETFTSQPLHYRDVLVATVDEATGALGEWKSQPLPWNISTHSATYADGYVYVVGGFDDQLQLLGNVRRAKVGEDGALGPFEEFSPLLVPRAHVHHTPIHDGRLYTVGGNVGGHTTQDVVLVGLIY